MNGCDAEGVVSVTVAEGDGSLFGCFCDKTVWREAKKLRNFAAFALTLH